MFGKEERDIIKNPVDSIFNVFAKPCHAVTQRRLEPFLYIKAGYSIDETAREMGVQSDCIKKSIKIIKDNLGVRTLHRATLEVVHQGLIRHCVTDNLLEETQVNSNHKDMVMAMITLDLKANATASIINKSSASIQTYCRKLKACLGARTMEHAIMILVDNDLVQFKPDNPANKIRMQDGLFELLSPQ